MSISVSNVQSSEVRSPPCDVPSSVPSASTTLADSSSDQRKEKKRKKKRIVPSCDLGCLANQIRERIFAPSSLRMLSLPPPIFIPDELLLAFDLNVSIEYNAKFSWFSFEFNASNVNVHSNLISFKLNLPKYFYNKK